MKKIEVSYLKRLKDKSLKVIDTEIKSIVGNAATFAQESLEPSEAELFTDITIN